MKKIILLIMILLFICGCQNNNNSKIDIKEDDVVNLNVKITINENTYNILLDDTKTNREFVKLLPLEIKMNELNGNEKYTYLDQSLSTNIYNPKQIMKGDIMLYNNNCLVLFYKNFDTNYSYTKIGHIDNLEDLDNSDILVRWENE